MKLQLPDISQQTTWQDVQRFCAQAFGKLTDSINGKLSLSENIDCKLVSATFTTANAELAVAHNLGRVPVGYLPYNLSAATIVYTGGTTWTNTVIYLKATVATTVHFIVF